MGKKYYIKPSCEVITLSDGIRILVPSFGGDAGAADDGGVIGGEAKSIDMEIKPWELDSSKDSTDYFFVPCLGQITYNSSKTPNVPTFTLVGAQGFYWTKTPLMYNFGQTEFFYRPYTASYDYSSVENNDNAFYLNIHHNYVALSWQQSGIYMKSGMRIANTDMFK